MTAPYDVCATVVSDLEFDARVWKEVRSLAAAGYRVALIGCRYGIDSVVRRTEAGVDVIEIPLGPSSRERRLTHSVRALLLLWLTVLRTRARVYHTHNVHPAPAAWMSSRLSHAAVVYDAHELYGDWGEGGLLGRVRNAFSIGVERWMVRRSNVVITTNPTRAGLLQQRHGNRAVVVLANVPLRQDRVEPIDPGFPRDAKVLLYQGGIYAERAFRKPSTQ